MIQLKILFTNPVRLAALSVCLFTLYACDSGRSTTVQDNIDTTTPVATEKALFNPGDSVVPFPSDLMFGSDGTLNLPVANDTDYSDPKVAMNTAWGFATDTSMSTTFSSSIDAAGIDGDSVRVYQVTLSSTPGGAVVAVNNRLTYGYGGDYVVSVSGFDDKTLVITPLKPLRYGSSYLVVLTDGLHNTGGTAYVADFVYSLLKQNKHLVDVNGNSLVGVIPDPKDAAALEQLRIATNYNEATVTGSDNTLSRESIILSWTFTTQPAGQVLEQTRNLVINATPVSKVNSTSTTDSPGALATILVGTLQVPYYLQAPSQANPLAPLNSYWKNADGTFLIPASPAPQKTSDQTIPLLVSIPKSDPNNPLTQKPAGGWPVVVFQHGITGNRSNLLGVADALAKAGLAAVAIDLPLHGITDSTNALRMATEAFDGTVQERNFDLDFVNNTTLAPGPDGTADDSGFHFINLSNLAVTRDNVRQGVADLFTLTKALQTMDYDGDPNNTDFDASRIYFMGHSLGAIVGTVFLAMESNVQDAVLAMPGESLAKLLDGSAAFGPTIAAGLQANGVVKGTADYEAFMMAAQTVIDSADPVNYVDRAGNGRGVLLFQVIGDMVIPNTVPDANSPTGTVPAPLAGTTPMAMSLGLTAYSATATGSNLQAWVRFSTPDSIGSAHHGSVLTPTNTAGAADSVSQAVFTEMQSELATFLATDGNTLSINNTTYVVSP